MAGYNKVGFPKTSFMLAGSVTTAGAMGTTVFADEIVVGKGPNFADDAGAANALVATITSTVAGVLVPPTVGMMVILKTRNALQRGANTFNLNSSGAKSIVKLNNYAQNLDTVVAAGAMLTLIYDGTRWQAVGY